MEQASLPLTDRLVDCECGVQWGARDPANGPSSAGHTFQAEADRLKEDAPARSHVATVTSAYISLFCQTSFKTL